MVAEVMSALMVASHDNECVSMVAQDTLIYREERTKQGGGIVKGGWVTQSGLH
jgi:hypothetical protein